MSQRTMVARRPAIALVAMLAVLATLASVAAPRSETGDGSAAFYDPMYSLAIERSHGDLTQTGTLTTWKHGGAVQVPIDGHEFLRIARAWIPSAGADLVGTRPHAAGWGTHLEGCDILTVANAYFSADTAIVLAAPVGPPLVESECLRGEESQTWLVQGSNNQFPTLYLCGTAQHWALPVQAPSESPQCVSFSNEYQVVGQGVLYNVMFFGVQIDFFIATGPAQLLMGNLY